MEGVLFDCSAAADLGCGSVRDNGASRIVSSRAAGLFQGEEADGRGP
jgi:hypothetical protein